VVSGGETLIVDGTAISTTVNSGGTMQVNQSGTASTTAVSSGGYEVVSYGGTLTSTTVSGGGEEVVSGGTAISTTVNSGGAEFVHFSYNGGTTTGTTVSSGGAEFVFSHGTASGTVVNSGGYLVVAPGGSATSTSGGGTIVSSGVVVYQPNFGVTIYASATSNVGLLNNDSVELVLPGGSAIRTTMISGGAEDVFSGGAAISTTVIRGDEFVFSGGTASFTTVADGAAEVVSGGGKTISTAVDNGGTQNVDGGTASFTTVFYGGTEVMSFGATTSTTVNSGGTEVVSGGTASFTTLSGGTEVVLYAGGPIGTASGTIVNDGGTEDVQGARAYNTTVNSGGTVEVIYSVDAGFGGTAVSTTVNSGGTEVVSSGGTATSTTLNLGGMIDVASLAYTSGGSASVNSSTDFLTVSVGGQSYTQTLVGNYTGETFVLANDGSGGTLVTAACYRAGTLIRTDRGEVPVEQLRAGDRVASAFGGMTQVVWLGHRRVDCRRHPRPQDVWPVRVAAGAFGAERPRRDIWLSPDHAVFVTGDAASGAPGVLIPIRTLVNGATITQEAVDEVMYWHVELPAHDVIFAEGLAAESYLDTGNRGAFANGDGPVMLNPDFALRVWDAESCAPLVRDGAELVAVRSALLERAEALGYAMTRESGLHLVADGRIVRPIRQASVYLFPIAGHATTARLVSRSAVPAAMHADRDDHRRLGVAISRISLNEAAIALTDPRLGAGWHDIESGGSGKSWRWTDGDAVLALAGGGVLGVEVAMTERYWLTHTPKVARVA
jgi:autotransporter passenger strand-loop-strand repeat protein